MGAIAVKKPRDPTSRGRDPGRHRQGRGDTGAGAEPTDLPRKRVRLGQESRRRSLGPGAGPYTRFLHRLRQGIDYPGGTGPMPAAEAGEAATDR
ncbi:hypothetical protein PLESTB_001205100 [Pleodorina starrii]|uniref:Uncharacterized protein n=1 Tax=Pleodorina starrii TaxID=330485 RepID=A0A9W6BST7_9CHLO|nr:hypothetical protein PLESTB_001205100 [Pleodorina starrii]